MKAWPALTAALICGPGAGAQAQIVFEPETPPAPTRSLGPSGQPPSSAPPANSPPEPVQKSLLDGWTPPAIDLRFVNRFFVNTAFDYKGENVAEWYRFLTASLRTEHGSLRVVLTARLRWVSYEEAPASQTFNLFNGGSPHSEFEPTLGETFISGTNWGLNWSAGMLDIAWGQNVAYSPADVFTPIDLRDGPLISPDDRLPIPAARLRGRLGPIDWDAVWLPVFMPSQFPLLGNDWSPYAAATRPVIPNLQGFFDPTTWSTLQSNLLATRYPQLDLTAPQGGVRVSSRQGPVTLAASWADFFDRTPVVTASQSLRSLSNAIASGNQALEELAALSVANDLQHGVAPLSATFERTQIVEADAALLTGPVRWTVDAGWSPARSLPLVDLTTIVRPMFSGSAGLEWEGPPVLAAGVYSMLAFNVPAGAQILLIDPPNVAAVRERDAALIVAYLAVRELLLNDQLELDLTGTSTTRGDFFLNPAIRWHITDIHGVGVGANVIGGGRGSVGAEYAHNDEVFVEYVLHL